MRIYIVVEDMYAKEAIKTLLKTFNLWKPRDFEIRSFPICSNKMKRIVKAALENFDKVVVLVDSETRDPREVEQEIKEKHLGFSQKGRIIVVTPCLEEWPCKVLSLKNCDVAPCSLGPIKALKEYWKQRHGRDYEKKLLPIAMEKAFSNIGNLSYEYICTLSPSLCNFLKEISE